MKLNMSMMPDGSKRFSVDGHELSRQEPQLAFKLNAHAAITFELTPIGIIADVFYCGTRCRQVTFYQSAGIAGWGATAKRLRQDLESLAEELLSDGLPGMEVDVCPESQECAKLDLSKLLAPSKKIITPR